MEFVKYLSCGVLIVSAHQSDNLPLSDVIVQKYKKKKAASKFIDRVLSKTLRRLGPSNAPPHVASVDRINSGEFGHHVRTSHTGSEVMLPKMQPLDNPAWEFGHSHLGDIF